ncbi:MAG TPA: sensor domain-containing diguanylate cyclase, partial [Trebonia sp.]
MTQDSSTPDGHAPPAGHWRSLWRRCHGLLSPSLPAGPTSPAEREQARRGRLLGTLLAANLPIAAVQALAGLAHPDGSTAGLSLFLLLLILCARLNRRCRTAAACRLFVATQFVVGVSLMTGSAGGQAIPGFITGVFTVLLSGFLVSRRAPFLAAALSAALVVSNGLRHPGALPLPPHTGPLLPLIVLAPSFFSFMLAVITSLGAGGLEDALARADEADDLERHVAERTAALVESRERLHFALKGADLGAWNCDIVTGQATLSEECCRLLGLPPDRTMIRRDDLVRMIHPDDLPALQEKAAAAAQAGGGYQHEVRVLRPDGGTRWLATMGRFNHDPATGALRTVDGAVMDITDRKTMEAERERLLAEAVARADRDALTGLLNHRAFHRRLDEEADRAQRTGQPLAVAMLDLDNFKFFNDAYGHLAGDEVIRQVAAALQGACRSYDTLARFGGDEFALLMPGVGVAEAAGIVARAQDALDELGFRPPGHGVA